MPLKSLDVHFYYGKIPTLTGRVLKTKMLCNIATNGAHYNQHNQLLSVNSVLNGMLLIILNNNIK